MKPGRVKLSECARRVEHLSPAPGCDHKPRCLPDRTNMKARTDMEAKMARCSGRDDYAECIRALGWREPLFQDGRFKPNIVIRK
jgi:hypothetical protein